VPWALTRAGLLPLTLLAALTLGTPARAEAEDPVPAARAMLAAWHEEPARIDRARAMLETAAAVDAAPETLIELARAWFLTGDFRAQATRERATAYEQGSDAARRAVAAAPQDDRAHLWLAINLGRAAEIKGVMRALALVTTIREESGTVLKLNPANVEGLILAGGLAAELPAFIGGDRVKAEALFKRALETDPHQTGGRLELARLYLGAKRWRDAERELTRVVDEPAATDLPRWTVSDRPRARALLAELSDRGRATTGPREAP
jgi:tetratricopeptide (TPR) repeat protein